jgi:hypothetical protein
VPFRNPSFIGRTEELLQIHDRLAGGGGTVLLLRGLDGIGKTELAAEYAHRFAAEYDLLWWVSAPGREQVRRSLAELAGRIGKGDGPDQRAAARAAVDALRRGRPFHRWMLVFDGADSVDELQEFIPGATGHVIITSSSRGRGDITEDLDVEVFTRADSIAMLRSRVPRMSEATAERLAEAVGDLPAALVAVASWFVVTGMSVDVYLAQLEADPIRVLDEGIDAAGRPAPVSRTWAASIDRLRAGSPAAADLLEVCAFLGPGRIPLSVLSSEVLGEVLGPRGDRAADPMLPGRLLRDLGQHSLARVNLGEASLEIHPLVLAVVRDRLPPRQREQRRRDAHRLLGQPPPFAGSE